MKSPLSRAVPPLLAALLLLAGPAGAQDGGGAPGGGAPKPLKDLFKGKVVSVKGRRIDIAYDFSDPVQAQDWASSYPFLRPATSGGFRLDGKALRGDGNAGWRHRAVFDGDLRLTATIACEDAKNFGAVVMDEDRTQFDLFGLADTVFSLMDRKAPLQHMLTTFLPSGQGAGGNTEWRYVATSYEPRVGTDPLEISVRKRGAMNEFRFGASGRLSGNDREARVGGRLAVAFYVLGSKVVVTKASVSGVLDAKWLREQGAAFEDSTPEDPDPLEGEKEKPKDPAPPAGGGPDAKGPAAGTEWAVLAGKLGNPSLPKEEREKAAAALVEGKERLALRAMIDLMYNEEDLLGRDLAARVFRGISGKETGFRADLPKDARLKVMPRVWDVWYGVKEQLDREEAKKKDKDKEK